MSELIDCARCRFYAFNHLIVCAIHPDGATTHPCPDFSPGLEHQHQYWENFRQLQQQNLELLELLDTHPILTGKCPACDSEMEYDYCATVNWDCPCGWTDNEI